MEHPRVAVIDTAFAQDRRLRAGVADKLVSFEAVGGECFTGGTAQFAEVSRLAQMFEILLNIIAGVLFLAFGRDTQKVIYGELLFDGHHSPNPQAEIGAFLFSYFACERGIWTTGQSFAIRPTFHAF
ncbi:hypothetical protein TALK_04835 [Thalassospira alkalitolerans]|uniref:Uncharacterized protein n=1 Tax=Thalassospira alkalitolerans TaxID=1293890 RepID=A0A1Y2LG75_9PROT|nr:hypothetical protein TALK_04835 [Thalassospira alkalitolerans]